MNLSDYLARNIQLRPDHPAVEEGTRIISYRQFGECVDTLARGLIGFGMGPGKLIAFKLGNSMEQMALMWAIAKCGCTMCPFRINCEAEVVNETITDLGVDLLVVDRQETDIQGAKLIELRTLLISTVNSTESVSWPTIDGNEILKLSHSSGTTGKPKYFQFTLEQLVQRCQDYISNFGWTWQDRYYSNMDLGEPWGCDLSIAMLMAGATVVSEKYASHLDAIADINASRITVIVLLPWQIRNYLSLASREYPLLPGVKTLLSGGSFLSTNEKQQCEQLISRKYFEIYGSNEAGLVTFSSAADRERHPESVGRIVDGVRVEIVDGNQKAVADGEIGLVRIKSDLLPLEYINDPEANARSFVDGWYYPQDVGYKNADKYLFLKGRTDDMIDCRGAKFYPVEVENILSQFPGIHESVVLGWPDEISGQVAAAVFVSDPGISPQDINDFCLDRLENYKVPGYYIRVESIPKSVTGKVNLESVRMLVENALEKQV